MREIKFRAWHKEQERMYSAEEMGQDQLTLMTDGRGFVNISGTNTKLSRIDDGRTMIPLQYTGLKDKNGKEIYEGDIFSIPPDKHHYCEERNVVKWGIDGCLLEEHGLHLADYNERGEVIGNIHENPELLKEV